MMNNEEIDVNLITQVDLIGCHSPAIIITMYLLCIIVDEIVALY